jgi:outer membrane protein insertion porin family
VVNKILKLIIVITILLLNFSVYSQTGKYKLLDPAIASKTIELHLFIDGIETSFYADMLKDLSGVPLEELDDAIITILIGTKLYQNVEVEKLLTKDNETIFIARAQTIKRIQDVIINGLSSTEQIEYLRLLSTQRGQPYNETVVKSDSAKLEKNLIEHGYLNAKVDSVTVNDISSEYIQLVFNVTKNNPCRVDQVLIEDSYANILNFLTVPIETGSICDLKLINETLEIQKESYWEQGYLQAKVRVKDISYSLNKESAKITLQIDRGPRTTFQVFDQDSGLLNQDFLITKQGLTYSDIILMSDAELVNILTNFYQKQGYAFANVSTPERIIDKNGNTILKFLLKKGAFVKIGKINFIGKLPVSEDQALENIGLKKGIFSTGIPFVQDNLSTYRDKLKNLYLDNGYMDVQVSIPDFIPSQDKTEMNLIFRAEKGNKYIINNIEISGNVDAFYPDQKKLSSILTIGDPFSYLKSQNYLEEYRRQLLSQGYLYAEIQKSQVLLPDSSDLRKVNLVLNITPGPVVRIRKIYVDSDIIGKDSAIISASALEVGEIFDQESFETARLRLLKHDLFSSAAIEALDMNAVGRKETRLDVLIHARAKTGYSLGLSPGWSNFRGYIFGTDFSLNKLNDDGLKFFSTASVSQEKQQQSFASTDTSQILGRQVNLGLSESLFKLGPVVTPLDMSSVFGYQVAAESLTNREYLTVVLSSEWKPAFFGLNWNFREAFIYENSKSTSSESAVVQTLDSPSITIREFLTSATLDTRNNPAWPTSGSLYNLQVGIARFGFGSDVQFNRYNGSVDTYFPIYKKLSGAISFGGKFITDTVNKDGTTVTPPASRRSTLTDSALVRGFPETYGSTAPGPLLWIHYANNGVANCNTQLASLGATNLMYLKSEARYRFSEIFGMVLFVDSAANYFTQQETNQINAQIGKQVATAQPSSTQCVPDGAALIAPNPIRLQDSNFLEQYWQQAYVSTGIGIRVILGNYATLSLDYGYPLKDPDAHCESPTQALNDSTSPVCVSRIQDSSYLWGSVQFKGAIHLKIGAQF